MTMLRLSLILTPTYMDLPLPHRRPEVEEGTVLATPALLSVDLTPCPPTRLLV
uniref:Uncharacterized protein n=1 Tax=Arundo donax TaxID=35708 RepID=A0A0A9FKG3_ARUDO